MIATLNMSEIRVPLVARVRSEILNGLYPLDDPMRTEVMIDRLLPEVTGPDPPPLSVPQEAERATVNNERLFTPVGGERQGTEAGRNDSPR